MARLAMEDVTLPKPLPLRVALTETRVRLEAAKHLAPDGVKCHIENIAHQLAVLKASLDPDPKSTR
jgi:hypothetical protein